MVYRNILNGAALTAENVNGVFEYNPDSGFLYRKMVGGNVEKASKTNNRDDHNVVAYNGKNYQSTHIIWLIVHGRWPEKYIEHKDTNKKNDKLENLRECNQSQNMANVGPSKRSKTGIKGVFWDSTRGKYYACIGHNYKRINLGRYDTKEEAKAAYDKKAKELFGEFARV